MITPRATRLLRVPDLQAMHCAVATCTTFSDPLDARGCAVIVPTRAAAETLRRTLETSRARSSDDKLRVVPSQVEGALGQEGALILRQIVTRADLYSSLHERLSGAPALLSESEREVLFRRAARRASAETPPPFKIRPGLIAEMLAFYDELRRRHRSVADFARLMTDSLAASADYDRGAERLLRQTRFLAAAFMEFEKSIEATGCLDEHRLRSLLLTNTEPSGFRRVVITVSDQTADPLGLWTADFDLLARIHGLTSIDVIATESLLATGFHERLHDLLPGIEEERWGTPAVTPVLASPEVEDAEGDNRPVLWYRSRDREEELVDLARSVMPRSQPQKNTDEHRTAQPQTNTNEHGTPQPQTDTDEHGTPLSQSQKNTDEHGTPQPQTDTDEHGTRSLARVGVVFQRPLPYLYLARHVFADAELPYQAFDALPLAAEPFAAALDLVFAFVTSEATRASVVALLGSPQWRFAGADGQALTREAVDALDARLAELKYLGGWDRLSALAAEADMSDTARNLRSRSWRSASSAVRAAHGAALQLRKLDSAATASAQIETLLAFIRNHERLPDPALDVARARTDAWHARHLRAREAVLSALEALAQAHARHDNDRLPVVELTSTIRRWIEGQTFSPRTGWTGVILLDAPAAAFADLDYVRIVGLVETDWPDRGRRNIFYPAALLSQLGWANELDRLAAARARFHDLLRLAKETVSVSTFTLENDAIVAPSPFLDELESSGLPVQRRAVGISPRISIHEALCDEPLVHSGVRGAAAEWLELRLSRSSSDETRFHGGAGPRSPGVYAVSHVERYLECPFKYFATHVLRLGEERDDESGLSPQERGQLLHDVFEQFFTAWHDAGHQTITADKLDHALAVFERVADACLDALPEADRPLERTHLLGSAASPGLAERAFAFEIEQGVGVLERLLEYPLEGEFEFKADGQARVLRIRAKADRIDLLADGTLRLIDYKLGRAPKPSRALQLPIYGVCAEQHLNRDVSPFRVFPCSSVANVPPCSSVASDPPRASVARPWTVSRAGYVAFREKNTFVALGSSSSLQEAFVEGQRRLLEAVAAIERGEFPPKPDEAFICTRCAYAGVCRKDYVGDE